MSWFVVFVISLFSVSVCKSQVLHPDGVLTHQDTLRGTLNPQRTWWNVLRYDVKVRPDYSTKTITGQVQLTFKAEETAKKMQLDLQAPMMIDSISFAGTGQNTSNKKRRNNNLPFTRDGNIALVDLTGMVDRNATAALNIFYHGKPREAARPPWDGGWIWTKDQQGRPWMSVACQGLGASMWYPCKDHQSDEPDSGASLSIVVSDTLVAVGNGRLAEKKHNADGTNTWTWKVRNPINNYDLVPYIGKYVNFTDSFDGEKGKLDCSYWVLDYNLPKARTQFPQSLSMLKCFEHWFGPYPFYEDSYKLVDAPHLGMEHQSAVAYGNKYGNGYLGRDLSGTGWGLKWDFIIVHESGHEWFGNNITSKDLADMWVHEGFTNYSETLYTECQFGKEAGSDYVIGTRKKIENKTPVIGVYGVNREGSGDMYYKGGNMLHTIRQVINDDDKFRNILRGLNKTFYHQTVTTAQVENYISSESGIDFSKVFDQYLRTVNVPVLEYRIDSAGINYRWTNCVAGFNLPVKVHAEKEYWLHPTTEWQFEKTPSANDVTLTVDRNFYVTVKNASK